MPSPLKFQRPTAANADAATTAVSTCPRRHKQLQPSVKRLCLTSGIMKVPDRVELCHTHAVGPSQCCSIVVQNVDASPNVVWSILRRFDNPQGYKHFVRSCHVVAGDGCHVGSLREIHVVSGLPAEFSVERLEVLDEKQRIISFSVVGGDHRLKNYRSVTTVHQSPDRRGTVVVESYVVDVPTGNTKEETCSFADTIVRCNLQSLAQLAVNTAKTESAKELVKKEGF